MSACVGGYNIAVGEYNTDAVSTCEQGKTLHESDRRAVAVLACALSPSQKRSRFIEAFSTTASISWAVIRPIVQKRLLRGLQWDAAYWWAACKHELHEAGSAHERSLIPGITDVPLHHQKFDILLVLSSPLNGDTAFERWHSPPTTSYPI